MWARTRDIVGSVLLHVSWNERNEPRTAGTAKLLGGGSSLNGGSCWRGERAVLTGLGFDSSEVARAFDEVESVACVAEGRTSQFTSAFSDGWRTLGYNDITADQAGGASWAVPASLGVQRAKSLWNGTRVSAAHALTLQSAGPKPTAHTVHAFTDRAQCMLTALHSVCCRPEPHGRVACDSAARQFRGQRCPRCHVHHRECGQVSCCPLGRGGGSSKSVLDAHP
jgi:hypothetical protein